MLAPLVLLAIAAVTDAAELASEGTLELVIHDEADGRARVDAYLVRPAAPRLLLHDVFGDVQPLEPGSRIWVEGNRAGDEVWVSRFAVLEGATRPSALSAAGPLIRQLNAVSVGFQNQQIDASPEAVQWLRNYFHGAGTGSVADYFSEVSYGQLQFVGDAYILNLPIDNPAGPDCDANCVLGAALGAIYQHYPEAMASFTALIGPFGGSYASVGTPGQFAGGVAILNGVGTAVHELGHVMGNWHSGAYYCNPGPYDADAAQCSGWQYGPLSAMGVGGGHFQAGQKRQLGWLSASDVLAVTNDIVPLAPFELPSTLPLALQVGPYLIENRQPIGADRFVGAAGLTFSVQRSLYTAGSGYTDFVFLKTTAGDCSVTCPVTLPLGSVFHDPNYSPAPLWVEVVATFDEAAMVLVHAGEEPLAIRDVRAVVDDRRATITWHTDVPASSQVSYGGRAVALNAASALDGALVTDHSVTLTDLPSATHLVFRVASLAADTPGYAYGELTTRELDEPVPQAPEPSGPAPTAPAPSVGNDAEVPTNAADDGVVAGTVAGGCMSVSPAWWLVLPACLRRRRRPG